MFRTHSASKKQSKGSPLQVSLLVIAYAAIHSLLASRPAKELVERTMGVRTRNGLYRAGFIAQSVLVTAWAIRIFLKLPDRDLYCVPKPWSWLWRAMQAASLTLLTSALHTVEIRRILGLPQLIAFLKGDTPQPEPEAQGPALAADGRIDARGPFRYIRHPDNLPIITLLWSFRRMTVNRLTLACLSTIYAILGSFHEDSRLRARYGQAYMDYTRRVPMLIPGAMDRSKQSV